MPDDLIVISLILVFLNEVCCTGKRNLIDIFINLIGCHADAVILKGNGFVIGINNDIHSALIILRLLPLPDESQLFKLCNCIAGIGNLLTDKNILV